MIVGSRGQARVRKGCGTREDGGRKEEEPAKEEVAGEREVRCLENSVRDLCVAFKDRNSHLDEIERWKVGEQWHWAGQLVPPWKVVPAQGLELTGITWGCT